MQVLCRKMCLLIVGRRLLFLPCTKLRSENREGLHVSIPERMVSYRLLLVQVRKQWACHQSILMQRPLHCCMGRNAMGRKSRRWAVLAIDVDGHCVHNPVSLAWHGAVLMAAVCLPWLQSLELGRTLCP